MALRLREKTLPWLAKAARLSVSTVYRWKEGAIPQGRVLEEVARVLRVRREWLESGLGPMEPPGAAMLREETVAYRAEASPERLDSVAEILIQHLDPNLLAKVLADYIVAAESGDRSALENARRLIERIRIIRPELIE